jgi:hypothetical protein
MVDDEKIQMLMFQYFEDADEERMRPEDYVIDSDGAVHVNTHINMYKGTTNRMLPVQFAVVDGSCIFSDRGLISLKGAPLHVNGDFDCSMNALTSLAHAPKTIARMGGQFRCDGNLLTSLAYAPKNAAEIVCNDNRLTNLQDAPPCGHLWAPNNPFESFKHTPDHIHEITISYEPNLPLLGLLAVGKIDFEHDSDLTQLKKILNNYTRQGRVGQLQCAAELVRQGYKSHAHF